MRRAGEVMVAASPRTETEALIIGGGPAGAALGVHLARRGRPVEIIEQTPGMHHKVCGEFLSREAVSYIGQLGIDLHALGAVPIHGMRLATRKCIAECELPFPALSLTRRKLDESLLSLASREGVLVLRGRRVESLQQTGPASSPAWKTQLTGGEVRHAKAAFLATGKHDLGRHRRPAGKQNDLIAFKMYFRVSPSQQQALCGWIDLVMFPGGYAGLQLTEDGDANLCLLVNRKTLQSCGNNWSTLFEKMIDSSDHLAQRLSDAQPLLPRPLALSSIPYGLLVNQPASDLWRLGDQAAVIPSFSGDGMSIALHSAMFAAEIYTRGGTPAELADCLHKQLSRSIHLATFLSRLMVGAPWLAFVVRVWPSLLSAFATHTRVPRDALLSDRLIAPVHER